MANRGKLQRLYYNRIKFARLSSATNFQRFLDLEWHDVMNTPTPCPSRCDFYPLEGIMK